MARIQDLAEESYRLELKIAREQNKLRLKLAQLMKSSLSRHSPPSTTPPSRSSDAAEFEPDEEWKEQLRKKIEAELQSMVQAAKDTNREDLKRGIISPSDLEFEDEKAMKNIRKIADDQYRDALDRERNERRWAGGAPMDPGWGRVLHEEQEDILASIKQPRHSKSQSPSGRFATEIISEDNQGDIPNGRYKPTPSPLSNKQREVLREEDEPESRDDSEEESSGDSEASEELIGDEETLGARRARAGEFAERNQPQPFQEDDFILLDARIVEEQARLLQQAQFRKRDEAFKLGHQQSNYRLREDEQAQFRQREEEIKRRRAEERKRSATVSSDSGRWSGAPNPNPSTSPVTPSSLSNGVPKSTPQYNSASIWEKNLNNWRTSPQAARPSSTKPAQVPARPSSTKPVGFAQSLPPARPWSVAPPWAAKNAFSYPACGTLSRPGPHPDSRTRPFASSLGIQRSLREYGKVGPRFATDPGLTSAIMTST
ncbi:hypothetical protein M413DRAFT_10547 [Hebeloma cylindrosporum]|uniref:Uncharacterized protein n=1 Tax=Hebeloma cylindrosporum TaxID=76867 RepID=A0A0C3CDX3_HEBCY|nr:hypothetical protein M413DRAFT_10547 [Hebeloma cylindrosporum h7]